MMQVWRAAAAGVILAMGAAPAWAQDARAADRYPACAAAQGADQRIADICVLVDDIDAQLASHRAGAHQRRWAELHHALGMALYVIGSEGDEAALRDSIAASRVAAQYYSPDRTPTRWAATQIHISGALMELGERGDEAALREALPVAQAARDAIVRSRQPELWASAQVAVANAHILRARSGGRQELIEAAAALRAALEIYRRPVFAEHRARTEALLAEVLEALGEGEADRT